MIVLHHIKTTALAALFAGAMMGGAASAATCSVSDVTITSLGAPDIVATSCSAAISGNDTGNGGTLLTNLNDGLFADFTDDWSLFGKSDDSGSGVLADEEKVGEWSVDFGSAAYSVFALSLKASTYYAVYLFDLRPDMYSMLGGEFSVFITNNGGQTADLSHLTVATFGTPAPVPLPAAGLLLLGALGGLGLMARRRKTA